MPSKEDEFLRPFAETDARSTDEASPLSEDLFKRRLDELQRQADEYRFSIIIGPQIEKLRIEIWDRFQRIEDRLDAWIPRQPPVDEERMWLFNRLAAYEETLLKLMECHRCGSRNCDHPVSDSRTAEARRMYHEMNRPGQSR